MRPKSDYTKVQMNYAIVATTMYQRKIESLVGRITFFPDKIQLNNYKIHNMDYPPKINNNE